MFLGSNAPLFPLPGASVAMQIYRLVLAALVTPLAAVEIAAAAAKAEACARAWLADHAAPDEDQAALGELKGENPEAFAIVQALLTKRSLGLLDPRHPSKSFVGAKPVTSSDEDQTPAEAEQANVPPPDMSAAQTQTQMTVPKANKDWLNWKPASSAAEASISTGAVAESEPVQLQAMSATNKNWLNWRPADSAASDEAMVQQVLGAVASLKGGATGLLKKHQENAASGSGLSKDAQLFDMPADEPAQQPRRENVESAPQGMAVAKQAQPSQTKPAAAFRGTKPSVRADGEVTDVPLKVKTITSITQADSSPLSRDASLFGSAAAEKPETSTEVSHVAEPNPYLEAADMSNDLPAATKVPAELKSDNHYLQVLDLDGSGGTQATVQRVPAQVVKKQEKSSKKSALDAWLR